jgi:uncharacterized protein
MHFPTLMAECDPPAALAAEVAELMRQKAITHELGAAPLPSVVADFIDSEFELARAAFEDGRARVTEEVSERAEHFYRSVVERLEREASEAQALQSGPTTTP